MSKFIRPSLFLRRTLFAAFSVASLIVGGCGGGGGGSAPGNPAPPEPPLPPPPAITLLAGGLGGAGNTDGVQARFNGPVGLAVDSAGNVYVADSGNNMIRKITPTGVSTVAGSPGLSGAADGAGSAARFSGPQGVAIDAVGNIYIADSGNNAIRLITTSGMVTTIAGDAFGQPGNQDGNGLNARFTHPTGLALDASGNLLIADSGNSKIRRMSPSRQVVTLAGDGAGYADGPGAVARFNYPFAITVSRTGSIYVADSFNNLIRQISPDNVVTTLAGRPPGGSFVPFADGTGAAAAFHLPNAMVTDANGDIFLIDIGNNRIRKVTASGVVSTIPVDLASSFGVVSGIAINSAGNLLVSESNRHVVSSVTQAGVVTALQGQAAAIGFGDGAGANARFNRPGHIAVDATGNAIVTDTNNHTIRRITPNGVVTTLSGTAGSYGSIDGEASKASFAYPSSVAIARDGTLYVADRSFHVIRKLTNDGTVTTVAGKNWPSGPPVLPRGGGVVGSDPISVTIDGLGNLFVLDTNYGIRKIAAAGAESMLECTGGCFSQGPSTARAIVADNAGNLYVAEFYAITRISPAGIVTVLAGNRQTSGFTDGVGAAASFYLPSAIALDAGGNIFVADAGNNAIRKITQAGVVTTVAGRAGSSGVLLGALPGSLSAPSGIAVMANGTLLVTSENAVLKIQQ